MASARPTAIRRYGAGFPGRYHNDGYLHDLNPPGAIRDKPDAASWLCFPPPATAETNSLLATALAYVLDARRRLQGLHRVNDAELYMSRGTRFGGIMTSHIGSE